MVEGTPIEKPLFEGGIIGPVKGEANHVFSMNEEGRNKYKNFTTVLDVGSKTLIGTSAFVGVINFLDKNEEFFNSNLIHIAGFVGIGLIGLLLAKFRKKATSMVTEA